MVLNSVYMQVNVLAFGPIAEKMGGREHKFEVPPNSSVRFLLEEIGLDMWLGQGLREHKFEVPPNSSVRFLLEEIGLDMWLGQGLVLSINGSIVGEDEPISEGDEVALLPPVSGG